MIPKIREQYGQFLFGLGLVVYAALTFDLTLFDIDIEARPMRRGQKTISERILRRFVYDPNKQAQSIE